jgi:hypothetical protein
MRPTISTVEITGVMVSTDFGFTVFSGYSRHVVKTEDRIQRENGHFRHARRMALRANDAWGLQNKQRLAAAAKESSIILAGTQLASVLDLRLSSCAP